MTIKPRKSKSRRNFGTRRQYRRSRGKSTRVFIGVDFGNPFSAVAVLMRGLGGELRILDSFRLPSDTQQQASRLHRSHHLPPVEIKLYPYQQAAMELIASGQSMTLFPRGLGRARVLKQLEYFKGYSGKDEDFSPSEDSG